LSLDNFTNSANSALYYECNSYFVWCWFNYLHVYFEILVRYCNKDEHGINNIHVSMLAATRLLMLSLPLAI